MKNISKTYDFQKTEEDINKLWERSGFFNPDKFLDKDKRPIFSIVMPPPNVTGDLHMGHAEMLAIEDLLIRYHRMMGDRTLWIPGTDHASIATQNKVEKILKKEGTNRQILGNKEFLKRIIKFAKDSHDNIEKQIRKFGSSCDWGREAYTLDKIRSKAVKMIFKLMFDDKIVYRGEKIVNWCPRCSSTLSDDEVEYQAQKTKLYTFRYSKDFPILISTTRPETKLGDTAVAVNPKDKRYSRYIGKTFNVDFLGQKLNLKIIGDRSVEMDFGSGALGVTPAHSKVDEKIAKLNKLKFIKVINEEGKILQEFGEFKGLGVLEAREKIIGKLKKNNLLEKTQEIENNLSLCYRCNTPIEPLLSLQWFVDVNKKIPRYKKSLKELSIEAVTKGIFGRSKIKFIPHKFEKEYLRWVNNLEDWCISRQIIFGHKIPVWYKDDKILCDINAPREKGWQQETDTLDTWFSSGLWTFTVMAKEEADLVFKGKKIAIKGRDFQDFHPTSVLNTGYDIIFFWVARMILMTTYSISDIPFEKVYLHGLVKDEKGIKMSKSLGNVIDPIDVAQKFGADAVRLSLIIGSSPGNDMKLNEEKIAGFRKFTNKLWNISRYVLLRKEVGKNTILKKEKLSPADCWILEKFKKLIKKTDHDLQNFNLSRAGERLRDFTWSDFANWYLEISKFETNQKEKGIILRYILENLLKLWHPFTPFVTEAIWQSIKSNNLLMIEKWPESQTAFSVSKEKSKSFDLIQNIIQDLRILRAENKIPPKKKIDVSFEIVKNQWEGNDTKKTILSGENLIKKLRTGVNQIKILPKGKGKQDNAIYKSLGPINIVVHLEGVIDTKKEKERLQKELGKINILICGATTRLKDKNFLNKAPKGVVKKQKDILEKLMTEKVEIAKQLEI